MPFQQNCIYPLKHPDRYDDEFGEGYDHALVANYGPIAQDIRIHDAWIVKAEGELHPGLNRSPIPVRLEDVEQAQGRPFSRVYR